MNPALRAVLIQFHARGLLALVLSGRVAALLALLTRQVDDDSNFRLCHFTSLTFPKTKPLSRRSQGAKEAS